MVLPTNQAKYTTSSVKSQALAELSARASSLSGSAAGAGAGAPYFVGNPSSDVYKGKVLPRKDSLPLSEVQSGAPYKDYKAQPVMFFGETEAKNTKNPVKRVGKCGSTFQVADDVPGLHHFGRKNLCYQEWCPKCGKMHSAAHVRRVCRWVPKVRQLKQAGYVVIEFLRTDRGKFRTQESWRDAMNKAGAVLFGKRTERVRRAGGYFPRGLETWHWFNDDRPDYRPDVFNPHMNFLVDGGKLPREKLQKLKVDVCEALGVSKVILHYSYGDSPGWMLQKVWYIQRATFLERAWDDALADEQFRFRRSRSWGKWNDGPVWELKQAEAEGADTAGLEAVTKLQAHICPDCGEAMVPLAVRGYRTKPNRKTGERELVLDKDTGLPIPVYWSKPLPSILLEASGAVEIAESDFYRIPSGWFEPEPKRERVNMAELRRINAGRVKELRKQAKRENWREYVSANRNRYILEGGDFGEEEDS